MTTHVRNFAHPQRAISSSSTRSKLSHLAFLDPFCPADKFMNGTFQSGSGDAVVATFTANITSAAVTANARMVEGKTVTAGQIAGATIGMNDGCVVVLAENSEFRLDAYRFDRAGRHCGH